MTAWRAEALKVRRNAAARVPWVGFAIALLLGLGFLRSEAAIQTWAGLTAWHTLWTTFLLPLFLALLAGLTALRESRARGGGLWWRPVPWAVQGRAELAWLALLSLLMNAAVVLPSLPFGALAHLPGDIPVGRLLELTGVLTLASLPLLALGQRLARRFGLVAGLVVAFLGNFGSGNLTPVGWWTVTGRKPYRHRFPLSVIGYALRLYHRFPLSQRDVQELLHERGIQVSHETLRQWNIKFAPLLTEELRHREPRRGSRWFLDEVCMKVGGVTHWLWRAVDEHGAVLDILLQPQRDTAAARTFFTRLLGAYEVPEVIHTDKLWSYGAAIRELPVLHAVEHIQVVSTARCNNLVEQSHRPTRQQERSQLGFKRRRRTQEFLALHARVSNLHRHTRATVPAARRRRNQTAALLLWKEVLQQAA